MHVCFDGMLVLVNNQFMGPKWIVFVFQAKQVYILMYIINYIRSKFIFTTTR